MAIILSFTQPAARATRRMDRDGPADIVIFPGIRYERLESDKAQASRREIVPRMKTTVPALLQG